MKIRLYRLAAMVLLVLNTCACRGDKALVSVEYTGGPFWEKLSLQLHISADGEIREINHADLHRGRNGHFTTGEIETPSTGSLEIGFTLRASDGTTVSTGTVELPLKPDWRWNIVLLPTINDPKIHCFGCFGSKAFPLDPKFRATEKESLWIYWGGNSISNPVVY
jgi:hypothetical protein